MGREEGEGRREDTEDGEGGHREKMGREEGGGGEYYQQFIGSLQS